MSFIFKDKIFVLVFLGSLILHFFLISFKELWPKIFPQKQEQISLPVSYSNFSALDTNKKQVQEKDFSNKQIELNIKKRAGYKKASKSIRNRIKSNQQIESKRSLPKDKEALLNLSLNDIEDKNKEKFLNYFDKLRLIILSRLEFPSEALNNKNDEVGVLFTLNRDGNLAHISIDMPSRYSIFNNTTHETIKACDFPGFPPQIDKELLRFSLIISYKT